MPRYAVVAKDTLIGHAVLAERERLGRRTLVGPFEPLPAYELYRETLRGPAALLAGEPPTLPEEERARPAPSAAYMDRLLAIAALGLHLVDAAGEVVPTMGPPMIHDLPGSVEPSPRLFAILP